MAKDAMLPLVGHEQLRFQQLSQAQGAEQQNGRRVAMRPKNSQSGEQHHPEEVLQANDLPFSAE
jgi:hypothetical protein